MFSSFSGEPVLSPGLATPWRDALHFAPGRNDKVVVVGHLFFKNQEKVPLEVLAWDEEMTKRKFQAKKN